MRSLFRACVFVGALSLAGSASAATTVIKVDLGNTGPDFTFNGGVLSTANDGDASTAGDQNTNIDFVGFLTGLVDTVGSITVTAFASGSPTLFGDAVIQPASGGLFSLYDSANVLLLSGGFASGLLTGSLSSTAGSFFNTSVATLFAGSLLPFLQDQPAAISFAFTGIRSSAGDGMAINCEYENSCSLTSFTADATGNIDATAAVPEPATAALTLSAFVLGAIFRRRRVTA